MLSSSDGRAPPIELVTSSCTAIAAGASNDIRLPALLTRSYCEMGSAGSNDLPAEPFFSIAV